MRIDAGGVPTHHRRPGDAKAQFPPIAPGDADLVADRDVTEEGEMGVAVAGIDCRAGLAGGRRARDMTGTESQRLAARPREHDGAAAETRDEDARHRPGIGPGPRLDVLAGRERSGEGALEQDLREQRLGVDPHRLADENGAGDHQRGSDRTHDPDPPQPHDRRLAGKGSGAGAAPQRHCKSAEGWRARSRMAACAPGGAGETGDGFPPCCSASARVPAGSGVRGTTGENERHGAKSAPRMPAAPDQHEGQASAAQGKADPQPQLRVGRGLGQVAPPRGADTNFGAAGLGTLDTATAA